MYDESTHHHMHISHSRALSSNGNTADILCFGFTIIITTHETSSQSQRIQNAQTSALTNRPTHTHTHTQSAIYVDIHTPQYAI